MSDWKPGFRHQVRDMPGGGWRCVDCGRRFPVWPADSDACPGPAPQERRGLPHSGLLFDRVRTACPRCAGRGEPIEEEPAADGAA